MRLKNVPGSREKIQMSRYVMQFGGEHDSSVPETVAKETETLKGHWKERFGNDHPIHLEIGMGKGLFLMRHAAAEPEFNFIGIEKFSSVLVRALEKQEEMQLPNVMLIRMDAENICSVFDEEEIDKIYLNFSDPWPKERHAKRRLTSTAFFERYEKILKKGGEIVFKTDNTALFDFSLEQIEEAGWKLLCCTHDLHGSGGDESESHDNTLLKELRRSNIMTEYEEKFVAAGNKICLLAAMYN